MIRSKLALAVAATAAAGLAGATAVSASTAPPASEPAGTEAMTDGTAAASGDLDADGDGFVTLDEACASYGGLQAADGFRVNLVTGGLTREGIAASVDPARVTDYERFSALRRLGTAGEIAAPILWLALENTYVSGKVFPANGGI